MDITTWILVGILIALVLVLFVRPAETETETKAEPFVGGLPNMSELTTQALDAPPSTSELKNHYKTLLIFVDDDIRKNGFSGLRILADFRNRVYGRCDFRDDLKTEDVLAKWPAWMPPLDTTIKEPVPPVEDAVTAESKMLAYLARNFPKEPAAANDETANTVRSLLEDFGYRFVFKRGKEVENVAPNFAPNQLLKDWINPVGQLNNTRGRRIEEEYKSTCIPSP
jgi:hypothetical protein